jgi:hypothetical protein
MSISSATLDARAISRDQVVYVTTVFTHNERLLRWNRLQMRRMQPLAKWYRDTECIINRKPNIEQVEAVNPEIIQDMGIGRDSAARNATIRSNKVRNNVKGGLH